MSARDPPNLRRTERPQKGSQKVKADRMNQRIATIQVIAGLAVDSL